jgi:5-formyltetrahydrofolate cyclo-ligase
MSGIETDKRHLRREMRTRLSALPPEQARIAGIRVAETIESLALWQRVRTVAVYKAVAGEVDTDFLVQRAWDSGRLVLLPRMEGHSLRFCEWHAGDALRRGPHDVMEPALDREQRSLAEAQLILVPGLAFDRAGGRLGRGAGYYDRALAEVLPRAAPPWMLGIGFALQVVGSVPMTRLDVRLGGVVTDEGWIGLDRSHALADAPGRDGES